MTNTKLSKLVKVSLLSAMAFILMFLEFPIPFFPPFLKFDFGDIPALLGGFALGPLAGVAIELIKNIVHLIFQNNTGGIGELANFISGSAFVFSASLIYGKHKSKKRAAIGMLVGTIVMTIVASAGNYAVFLPLYEKILNFPIPAVVGMAAKVNSNIKDLNTLIIYCFVPFNILKGVVVSGITFLLYKRVSRILHK